LVGPTQQPITQNTRKDVTILVGRPIKILGQIGPGQWIASNQVALCQHDIPSWISFVLYDDAQPVPRHVAATHALYGGVSPTGEVGEKERCAIAMVLSGDRALVGFKGSGSPPDLCHSWELVISKQFLPFELSIYVVRGNYE
jgi:hypothetical protein